jgi:hypothetical protein
MSIKCIRCGKDFNYSKCFLNHLIKNGKCIEKYIFIPKNVYIENYQKINSAFSSKISELENIKKLQYGCDQCGKIYSTKNYCYMHKNKKCKKKYEITNNQQLNNSLNLQGDNNIQQLNSPNISNNTNNVINILNYGSDVSDVIKKLPVNTKKNIIKQPVKAIQNMAKVIYIDTPENRNVYIKDSKDGFGYVYENGNWKPMNLSNLLFDILNISADHIQEVIEEDKFNQNKYIKSINKYFKNLTESDNSTTLQNQEKRNIRDVLITHSDVVKKNYEIILGNKVKLNMKPIKK